MAEDEPTSEDLRAYEEVDDDGHDAVESYGMLQADESEGEDEVDEKDEGLSESEVDKIANKLLSRMDMDWNISARAVETPSATLYPNNASRISQEVPEKPVIDIQVSLSFVYFR
jgi:hypothetical protein